MDGRNPPAVAKRHKTYGDAEDTASDGDYPMLAVISPRANDCASLKRRGCAASPFLCLAKDKEPKKGDPVAATTPALLGIPGGRPRGLLPPRPTRAIPRAPLRAIPGNPCDARRGKRGRKNCARDAITSLSTKSWHERIGSFSSV
jgi:hypothetical protein